MNKVSPAVRVVLVAVGLGCMLAYCRAFAIGFGGSLPMAARPEADAFSLACSASRVAAIVALVACGLAFRVSPGCVLLAASGATMAFSGFVLAGGCTLAQGMPFAILAGAASGAVMLAMMMTLSAMRIRDIVASSLGGLLAGGALIGGLMRLPVLPATGILVASGLLAGLLFAAVDPQGKATRADGIPTGAQARAFPWFAALAFAVGGIAVSLFYGAFVALGWNADGAVNHPLFAIAIVLALACTSYVVLQGEEVAAAAWIPLFVLLLMAMVLGCVDDAEVDASVAALLLAGVFAYHFLRWMVFPALISISGMPRMLVCGVVLVATSGLLGVGWGESIALGLPSGLREQGGFVAALALGLLVLFAVALLVTRVRLEDARLRIGFAEKELGKLHDRVASLSGQLEEQARQVPAVESPLEDRCAALAREGGLTAREEEILVLTARGHSSTYIAGELFISASTVRFHQQNVYRKLDVHSRQELLALVNDQ